MRRRRWLLPVVLGSTLLGLVAAGPYTPEPYVTELGRHALIITLEWLTPRRAHVAAQMTIPAPTARVWAVLTDYDHLPEFIPMLESSRVIRRQATELWLEQNGAIQLPFYRRPIRVVLRVEETPPFAVQFEAVEGDFVIHHGRWSLQAAAHDTLITYEATIEPAFSLPRWVMIHLERWFLKDTFRAILQRCAPGSP